MARDDDIDLAIGKVADHRYARIVDMPFGAVDELDDLNLNAMYL